ncbi:hypothetical protein Q8F55_002935 [Vanrija albida]|uniref:Uncharacterized protein n=1 Tax=Vanrija albida TaxID=181172 RepID=A0ABR3QB38_9TREE
MQFLHQYEDEDWVVLEEDWIVLDPKVTPAGTTRLNSGKASANSGRSAGSGGSVPSTNLAPTQFEQVHMAMVEAMEDEIHTGSSTGQTLATRRGITINPFQYKTSNNNGHNGAITAHKASINVVDAVVAGPVNKSHPVVARGMSSIDSAHPKPHKATPPRFLKLVNSIKHLHQVSTSTPAQLATTPTQTPTPVHDHTHPDFALPSWIDGPPTTPSGCGCPQCHLLPPGMSPTQQVHDYTQVEKKGPSCFGDLPPHPVTKDCHCMDCVLVWPPPVFISRSASTHRPGADFTINMSGFHAPSSSAQSPHNCTNSCIAAGCMSKAGSPIQATVEATHSSLDEVFQAIGIYSASDTAFGETTTAAAPSTAAKESYKVLSETPESRSLLKFLSSLLSGNLDEDLVGMGAGRHGQPVSSVYQLFSSKGKTEAEDQSKAGSSTKQTTNAAPQSVAVMNGDQLVSETAESHGLPTFASGGSFADAVEDFLSGCRGLHGEHITFMHKKILLAQGKTSAKL